MKISFAAKNLLCQKASFWHKPERCVPKEIIQQLLKLSFTSVLYTVSHPLEKSANGSNKASRFIWWCPHKGAVVLMQPSSMVKSKPIYFAVLLHLHWTSPWSNRGQDAKFDWDCLYNDFIHASDYSSSPYIWFSFYDQQNHPVFTGSISHLSGRIPEFREPEWHQP